MKKTIIFLLLCACLLLSACTAQTEPESAQPESETIQTELETTQNEPEPAPPAAETADTVASQEERTQERPALPVPSASMFSLTGREAVLYDAAVSQKYPRSDNDIVLPSLRVRGSFEEDGKTVVICDLHYDFYYDYTGPGWEWNGGGATTYLRAELETRSGAEICTGFAEYPSGSLSDWIRDYCARRLVPFGQQHAGRVSGRSRSHAGTGGSDAAGRL